MNKKDTHEIYATTDEGKIFCVVSGKGGSGKTLITSLIGESASNVGRVLLIDADFGTGGLTYFLTFKAFDRGAGGFCEIMREDIGPEFVFKFSKPRSTSKVSGSDTELLPIGDHKRFHLKRETVDQNGLEQFINYVRKKYDYIIFDCRGGIDDESVAISRLSDEIIVIVETDAASIRASQHLREVLEGEGLEERIRGFIINKAMDDPEQLSELYRTILFAEYLGAVPFDIEANKAFIKGEFPKTSSRFYSHCRHITGKIVDAPSLLNKRLTSNLLGASAYDYGSTGARKGRLLFLILSIYGFGIYLADKMLGGSPIGEAINVVNGEFFGLIVILVISIMTSDRIMEKIGNSIFDLLPSILKRRK